MSRSGRTSSTSRIPALLPAPKRIGEREGSYALRPGQPIVLGPDADDTDFRTARALQAALVRLRGLDLPIESHARSGDLGPHLALRRSGDEGEAYRLRVDAERIEVEGNGPAGLRYGVETLTQWVGPRGSVRGCEIEDAPDFRLRGIMLDVSRGKVPTLECLRALVDLCVRLKLNTLMLYIEHTFRSRRHPEIGAGESPLDAETLRALDAYAAERHVDLVPSLQSLGHMDHVLEIPAYAHLAETERRWTLSPAEPGTYELLSDLYDELLPNFRSRLFNANCDESFDLGKGRSAERAREIGRGGVFLEHVRRVRDMAAGHGKRTMIWSDMLHGHPEIAAEIDRDLLLLDWWYEADFDYDRVARWSEQGLEFAVCPGTSSWNCLFPRLENSAVNIQRWADAGRRHGARGLLVTDWGDFGHYNLLGNSWWAFAWAAQQAWSGDVEARTFDRAFSRVLFGDTSVETARIYRELGAIHDAGFEVFNACPLQFLFFDDLGADSLVPRARRAALRRSERRLLRVGERIDAAGPRFADDPLTADELRYAADATLFTVRKTLAALDLHDERVKPALGARDRRRLARRLESLADEQIQLGRELRRLWHARSRPSNFALTRGRIARSIRALRGAARRLA